MQNPSMIGIWALVFCLMLLTIFKQIFLASMNHDLLLCSPFKYFDDSKKILNLFLTKM